jgi:hypothetical protein
MSRAAAALVASTGRGAWTTTKRWGIPTVLVFDDAITDAINRTANHDAAVSAVEGAGRRFLDDAGRLSPTELAARIDEVGTAYRDYRNRLLAPIHEEDETLEAALADLNAKVAAGEIPDNTVDSRLDALLGEYGRRRTNIMADIYDRNRDAEHDMLHPSPNRTVSFQDEIDLLKAARAKVGSAEGRALIDARIADLTGLMNHEYELFRAGEHDALIAGIAGPPRLPGETAAPGATTSTTGAPSDLPAGDSMEGLFEAHDSTDAAPTTPTPGQ